MASDFLGWVNDNGAILGLLSFLLGLLVGHRMALGRDKRNEWNAVVDRVRGPLLKSRSHPTYIGIDDVGADAVKQVALTILSKRHVPRLIDRHLTGHRHLASAYHQNEVGDVLYLPEQVEAMQSHIESLLKVIRRT